MSRKLLDRYNVSNETDKVADEATGSVKVHLVEDMVKPAGTFCSLLERFCTDDACETCPLITSLFPRCIWLCSQCSDGHKIYPYWGDTECAE